VTGLDIFPEALRLKVLACLHRVEGPFALGGKLQELDGPDEHGAGGWAQVVLSAAEPEDDWAEAKHDGRQKPCTPEANVLLHVDHGDLSEKRSHIDEHVEVQEDAGDSNIRIRDDTLASRRILNHSRPGLTVLLSDEGRDIGLESTGSET
jgi:hypothetical protein